MLQQAPARTYRATLVPEGTCQDDIEALAADGKLPVAEVEAPSAYAARKAARLQTGHHHVHSVEVAA